MLNMKNEVKFLGWMTFALVILSGCQASETTPTKTPQPISPPPDTFPGEDKYTNYYSNPNHCTN